MKILVTGGCGNMGSHVVKALQQRGHALRVLDRDAAGLARLAGPGIDTVAGDIADRECVRRAVAGCDAILHLAWSFADDLLALLDTDVKGYKHLLDAALEFGAASVINATTAVSYGKPQTAVVDENHPHLVEQARKPTYALAKLMTEELSKIYAVEHGLAANNLMIWYAYGDEIGGKHLRGMVEDALEKGVVDVPAGSGGSFLQLDDFVSAVLALLEKKPKGETFNLGTVYLTWQDLAQMIVAQANPQAKVHAIPKESWKESAFLTDDWHFSTEKAERLLGYRSALNHEAAVAHLAKALESCVAGVKAQRAS